MKKLSLFLRKTEYEKLLIPLLFAGAYAKNLLLQCFFAGGDHYVPSPVENPRELILGLIFSFFSLCLFFAPVLLFKKRKSAAIYASVFSGLLTVFFMFDVCYYRAFPEMFSLSLFSLAGEAAQDGYLSPETVFGLFSAFDLLFFADWILALALALIRTVAKKKGGQPLPDAPGKPAGGRKKKKDGQDGGHGVKNAFRRLCASRVKRFLAFTALCLSVFLLLPALHLFGLASDLFYDLYEPPFRKTLAFSFTPAGWHLIDAFECAADLFSGDAPAPPPSPESPSDTPTGQNSPSETPTETPTADPPVSALTKKERQQIDDFYAFRARRNTASDLFGTFAGRNLLLLQVESLENNLLGQSVNGREITPFLNTLIKDGAPSIFFTGLHDQVKSGNSSDCDYMINTGLLPVADIFFKNHLDTKVPNIPALLRAHGYKTTHINGSGAHCVWDYRTAYRSVFGFNTDENDPACEFFLLEGKKSERINNYMSDEQILRFVYEKLKARDADRPFYMHTILCSSHMPFTGIYKALKSDELLLPVAEEDADNKTFAYINAVHYTDAQIGAFLERAQAEGLLDNTLVLIYGDHKGLHKYYPADAKSTADAHPEFSFIESEDDATVSFILYDPSGALGHRVCGAYGGQIDIMPTVLDLIGIPYEEYSFVMGRNLLASKGNYTVTPSGKVYAEDLLSSKENNVVYRMYKTAELIVKELDAQREA